MIAVRIRVSGRVQGVFYRASTKSKADELGLSGWVKNEPDGAVLMEIQGKEDAVKEMIMWCHHGPANAIVDKVEHEKIPLREFVRFEIRR